MNEFGVRKMTKYRNKWCLFHVSCVLLANVYKWCKSIIVLPNCFNLWSRQISHIETLSFSQSRWKILSLESPNSPSVFLAIPKVEEHLWQLLLLYFRIHRHTSLTRKLCHYHQNYLPLDIKCHGAILLSPSAFKVNEGVGGNMLSRQKYDI